MTKEVAFSAKALLANSKGEILLISEAEGENRGKFHFPGGKLKHNEKPKDALGREVFEETGISDLRIGTLYYTCSWPAEIGGKALDVVGLFYPCRTDDDGLLLSSEHSQGLWTPPETACDTLPMVSHSKEIIDAYLRLSLGERMIEPTA